MNKDNNMRSKYRNIFLIVTLLIITLLIQIFAYGEFYADLKKDTQIINDLSRIRGSIQRFTKLEMANVNNLELKEEIDTLINFYLTDKESSYLKSMGEYYDLNVLQDQWETLLIYIDEYQLDPSYTNMWNVIRGSEACWKTADTFVLRNQYFAEKTTSYFKYFTMTMIFNLVAIIIVLILYKKFVHNNLESSAIRDALTGVFNRRYFDDYLKHEILRAKRSKTIFSLIMMDIDHFKKVNDTYGHDIGDYALKTLTEIILNSIRKSDVLTRIGGEEFTILLPDTDLKNAIDLAEKIRTNTENYIFNEIGQMTISLGLTEFKEQDSSEIIMKRTDNALYLAKAKGRNRCEIMLENIGG